MAVALKQAMTPEFKVYQLQVLANCKALAAAMMEKGYKIVTGKLDVCLSFTCNNRLSSIYRDETDIAEELIKY